MAEFPALPLFTDAYLGDTSHLTTIEHGAYLLLLIVAWRSQGARLPDDDAKLAKYARMTRGQWARISPTIREFFKARDGFLYQSRLTDEANHVRQVRESQAKNGRASALKRKGRHSTTVEPSVSEASTPTPSPTPSNSEPIGSGAVAPDPAAIIFGAGLRVMVAGGVPESKARSMLGKWRGQHGDAALIEALGMAKREGALSPIEFIEGCFRSQRNGQYRNGSGGGSGEGDGFSRALRRASAKLAADESGGLQGHFGMG